MARIVAADDGALGTHKTVDIRDRVFLLALLAHVPVLIVVGLLGNVGTLGHVLFEACGPAALALVAYVWWSGTRMFRVAGAFILMLDSGVLIHFGNGLIELHFHVFVGLALLIFYYDWLPLVIAAATIAVHHLILDEILPTAVFQNGQNRWIVVLHATFVIIQTIGCVIVAERIRRTANSVRVSLETMADHEASSIDRGLAALAVGDLTVATSLSDTPPAGTAIDEIGRLSVDRKSVV